MYTIFVAYPYKLVGYREALATSLASPDYKLVYADEHLANDHVLRKIEGLLKECDLAIFDLTGANANVTLELGIAIAAKHPYVVVVQKEAVKGINADIHGWDQLRYENVDELSAELKARIERGTVPKRASIAAVEVIEPFYNNSPLGQKQFPAVWLTPEAMQSESIFGLHIVPERFNRHRHLFKPEDDKAMKGAELRSRGMSSSLHGALTQKTNEDGYLFTSASTGVKRGDGTYERPHEMISVDSDGEITIRFRQNDEMLLFQYLALIATGYMLAQDAFSLFQIAPKARFRAIIRLDARADATPNVPRNFDATVLVDVKEQTFASAFYELTMRFFRAAKITAEPEEVKDILATFERDNVSLPRESKA